MECHLSSLRVICVIVFVAWSGLNTVDLTRMATFVSHETMGTRERTQKAEFENVRAKFKVRKPGYFFGTDARAGGVAARISPFASVGKNRPYGDVFVARAPDASSQRRLLLSVFERGGVKEHTQGAASVAVPSRMFSRCSVPAGR